MLNPIQQDPVSIDRFHQLLETTSQICSINNLKELTDTLLVNAIKLVSADAGSIHLVKGQDQEKQLQLQSLVHRGNLAPIDFRTNASTNCWSHNQPKYELTIVKSALTRASVNLTDVKKQEQFDLTNDCILSFDPNYDIHSLLSIPISTNTDEVIAVIQVLNQQGAHRTFSEDDRSLLEALGNLVSIQLKSQMSSVEQHKILVRLSAEPSLEKLFDRILWEAQVITGAEGGTLYLMNKEQENHTLEFKVFHNYARNFPSERKKKTNHKPIPLQNEDGTPNTHNVAAYAANSKQTVNVPDAYEETNFDFSGTKAFDALNNYKSHSLLTVPLLNHENEVIGVLQLINARDITTKEIEAFSKHQEEIVKALASYASIALNNQILIDEHKKFLDAFIRCMASAIDAKSSHTGLHCQRVPVLTEMIAKACCENKGTLVDFDLNEDEWYELHVAAWLHDCGKLGTPDQILNKSTKLDLMRDTIDDIYHRLEIIKREKQIEVLSRKHIHPLQTLVAAHEYKVFADEINEEKDFLCRVNVGSEFMSEDDQARVRHIAQRKWFNDQNQPQPVLSESEIEFLCIQRGTLSQDERQQINNHIVLTIDMLESLPFPTKLRKVPEFAGGHHEKIDGTGYPRGLKGDELSLPAKMMAIADIFEALTASDRPYKKPMKISKALSILKNMRDKQHIDPDVYEVFITGKVWEKYAKEFLSPTQLDVNGYQNYL